MRIQNTRVLLISNSKNYLEVKNPPGIRKSQYQASGVKWIQMFSFSVSSEERGSVVSKSLSILK